jgi:hypothetical protein
VREVCVAACFGGIGHRPDGAGVPARQSEGRECSGVAHHGPAHQVAQTIAIDRFARFAWHHVGRPEILLGPENARLQQRQQIIQLDQIVLHRRR